MSRCNIYFEFELSNINIVISRAKEHVKIHTIPQKLGNKRCQESVLLGVDISVCLRNLDHRDASGEENRGGTVSWHLLFQNLCGTGLDEI